MNCRKPLISSKQSNTSFCLPIVLAFSLFISSLTNAQNAKPDTEKTTIRISFGHLAVQPLSYWVHLKSGSNGLTVSTPVGVDMENNDNTGVNSFLTAGGGDIDILTADVKWPKPTAELRKLASHAGSYASDKDAMWGYLLENGSEGQASRLKDDPWKKPDAPLLTVQLSEDGTKGFTFDIEQLLQHGAMWLPAYNLYLTLASTPVPFKQHLATLKGERTLDRVKNEPDASLTQFKRIWEDIGNPLQWNKPWETTWMGTRGHLIVTTALHGSQYKFAIDRWANVRPDFASPHKFRFNLTWPESQWKSQRITDGLPVIVTNLENKGQHCEIEQFAAPLSYSPPVKRGEPESVMFTKLKVSGKSGLINMGFSVGSESKNTVFDLTKAGTNWAIIERATGVIWLLIETGPDILIKAGEVSVAENNVVAAFACVGNLPAGQSREIILQLLSPALPATAAVKLASLDYTASRQATVQYWEDWLRQGANFKVPETAVNHLFRANLWHALILPRYRTGEQGEARIDLPYANTAYGQKNADWPINQGVYVDYMIYGLRGYWQVAEEEFAAMFQSQQQPDGRIGGYANWGVYSPGHLYAIAQNYLLSQDRTSFERMLPQSIKTLDWCLAQIALANTGEEATGLIRAPLNDLTHEEREWAFPQAYFVAGLDLFSRALALYGHPRAAEVK